MEVAAAPPPPPPPDLNAVYRPDDDAYVRHSIVAEAEEAPQARPAATFEEVLGLAPPPPEAPPQRPRVSEEEAFEDVLGLRPQARAPAAAPPLLDLLDAPLTQEAVGSAGDKGGLLAQLPPGVSPSSLAKPAAMIDLSGQSKAEEPPASASSSRPAAAATAPAAGAGAGAAAAPAPKPRPIPADAKGFGSEDLFGNGSQERTIKDEAVAAISSVYGMLPDQVKDQAKPYIPNCMETSNQDESTEQVFPAMRGAEAPGEGGAGLGVAAATPLEAQHTQVAVDRAYNGKWVPTYMRHQLAQNGHTALPSAPNAHEHAAAAPPASLGQAFAEMGEELGESAQTMLTFMLAFLSSLATQCQVCSHQAASSVHEQVITYGENLCNADSNMDQCEDRVMMGRPLSEAAAGLGPVRSQLRHHLQVRFAKLAEIVKRKLVTPYIPPDFQQAVKARELSREITVHEVSVEDWLFSTELRKEALPEASLPHLCRDAGSLTCYETWHVEMQEERAEVEISSAPAGGDVTAVLRLIITGKPMAEGGGCDVESRLFVRPQEHGALLPLGLVDSLLQVHQAYAESLRIAVLALAREMGSDDLPAPPTAKDDEPLPVVQLSLPEKRAPSWAADDGAPGKRATPPRPDVHLSALQPKSDGIDSSLLLQVAEGI